MKLREIAYSRAGDKGDIVNISVIAKEDKYYEILKEILTEKMVKDYFKDICKGKVERYCLDNLKSFNFILNNSLNGGVSLNNRIDRHGKSLSAAILEMELEI